MSQTETLIKNVDTDFGKSCDLQMLHAVNVFGGMLSQRYKKLSRGYSFLIPVAMLYVPYVFFKGR